MNKETFKNEIKKLGISITEQQLGELNMYYQILISENEKYNLTSIIKEEEVYLKHFYDSITLAKAINLTSQTLCDIGSGAGFPGIVLKIIFPDLKVTLIEATQKKCRFLEMVITTLNLKNIRVVNERIEIYSKTQREKYDIVTARAVAPLKHLLEYSIPLVNINGYFIAMKAQEEEININKYLLKLKIELEEKIIFKLPIENSVRTLLKFKKLEKTDSNYPRTYSEIKKKEL